MKKILIIISCILLCLTFIACSNDNVDGANPYVTINGREFMVGPSEYVRYYNIDGVFITLIDTETRVQYMTMNGLRRAAICVLVDADNKPILYEGEFKK